VMVADEQPVSALLVLVFLCFSPVSLCMSLYGLLPRLGMAAAPGGSGGVNCRPSARASVLSLLPPPAVKEMACFIVAIRPYQRSIDVRSFSNRLWRKESISLYLYAHARPSRADIYSKDLWPKQYYPPYLF
jgi:hypothetical protein